MAYFDQTAVGSFSITIVGHIAFLLRIRSGTENRTANRRQFREGTCKTAALSLQCLDLDLDISSFVVAQIDLLSFGASASSP